MSGVNISICDGKYTVIQAPTGTTRVLRYGEEWRDVTGDNVIGGLAWELQEARDRIKRQEELGHELRECASRIGTVASGEGSVIRRTEEAIQAWNKEANP